MLRFWRKRKEDYYRFVRGSYDALNKRVNELVSDTKYTLVLLDYAPMSFGNVIVLLACDNYVIRFTYDRGDIYRSKKYIDSERWIDEKLIYNHSMPLNETYDLLFKAIEEFVAIK